MAQEVPPRIHGQSQRQRSTIPVEARANFVTEYVFLIKVTWERIGKRRERITDTRKVLFLRSPSGNNESRIPRLINAATPAKNPETAKEPRRYLDWPLSPFHPAPPRYAAANIENRIKDKMRPVIVEIVGLIFGILRIPS
jgi:hypothetical protein